MRARLLRLPVFLLVFASAAPALGDMEVYHPKHRAADDLVPLVEVALAGEGQVAVDGNTGALVLVGTAAGIAQALQLLAIQDKPLRSVLIQHETRTAAELAASGTSLEWSVGGDRLRVGNVAGPRGTSVVVGEGRGRSGGSQVGVLRVLEGEWGRIASGSEQLLPIGSERYPNAVRVAAESGLEVRPRILGDGRVRLDLRPFQARFGAGGAVARAGADTTLVVRPGETTVVGGIGGSATSQTRGLLSGNARSQESSERLLLVTVTLDEEAGAR